MDFDMIIELTCNCGNKITINSSKCDKYICPKCNTTVYRDIDGNEFRCDCKSVNFRLKVKEGKDNKQVKDLAD